MPEKSDIARWLEAENEPAFKEGDTVRSVSDPEIKGVVLKIERFEHTTTEDEWHVLIDIEGPEWATLSRSSRDLVVVPDDKD